MTDPSEALAVALDELEAQRSAVREIGQLKRDLVSTLAHDIKGPLTSIVGFAELLEEGFLQGAEAIDAARTIRTNGQRLATLINDVVALSRVEDDQLEFASDRLNALEVLDAAVESMRAEREIDVQRDVDPAFVRGDAARLRQVFEHLLRNAIKYSPDGQPVRIVVRANGSRISIAFTDGGIGIPPEELPELFKRFARASNARKLKLAGTGVGLFIAKTIVERFDGTLTVESRLAEGSTFTITLPSAT
jgi:signal transduction histidine kinase